MMEGGRDVRDHAPNMASWDDSKDVSTQTVERVRRLLKRLFAPRPGDDRSPIPKP
jgi:hypothetical protein